MSSKEAMGRVVRWLARAKEAGSVIFAIVCPDYATRQTGNPAQPVEYTFDGLGGGIGLVAGRVAEALPALHRFGVEAELNTRFVVAIADYEASEENCRRVGLSREEFLARLRLSQECFRQAVAEIPDDRISTPFLSEVGDWERALGAAEHRVRDGAVAESLIRGAARARHAFYERWSGRRMRPEEAVRMVREQIPAYLAAGALATHTFDNPLLVGGDSLIMEPFIREGSDCAVLYLDRPRYD
ncbi:MAG TPA: hypothetical protein VJJ24_00720 [Candidatus Paceibacterota bacterium]